MSEKSKGSRFLTLFGKPGAKKKQSDCYSFSDAVLRRRVNRCLHASCAWDGIKFPAHARET